MEKSYDESYNESKVAQEMTETEREGLQIAGFLEEAVLAIRRLGVGRRHLKETANLTPAMRSLAFSMATAALTEAQYHLRRLGEIESLMIVGVEPVKLMRR